MGGHGLELGCRTTEQQACVSNIQVSASHHGNIYMFVQEHILLFIFHQF